jgi:UDPglucose--hexose-1-phosphate uridylyltransferase
MIQLLDMRHGNEFPFNFYIYPGIDWYIRIIPRLKLLGGLEVGTSLFVNTQDPKETFKFITEHFGNPDEEKIKTLHKATYRKGV